jgi:CheY-like chemotaxis protein
LLARLGYKLHTHLRVVENGLEALQVVQQDRNEWLQRAEGAWAAYQAHCRTSTAAAASSRAAGSTGAAESTSIPLPPPPQLGVDIIFMDLQMPSVDNAHGSEMAPSCRTQRRRAHPLSFFLIPCLYCAC